MKLEEGDIAVRRLLTSLTHKQSPLSLPRGTRAPAASLLPIRGSGGPKRQLREGIGRPRPQDLLISPLLEGHGLCPVGRSPYWPVLVDTVAERSGIGAEDCELSGCIKKTEPVLFWV